MKKIFEDKSKSVYHLSLGRKVRFTNPPYMRKLVLGVGWLFMAYAVLTLVFSVISLFRFGGYDFQLAFGFLLCSFLSVGAACLIKNLIK